MIGIFPSIQAAFACEKIDDRIQFTPECVQMDKEVMASHGDALISKDDINNADVTLIPIDNCCDLVSHHAAIIRVDGQDFSSELALLLDGPQPPPAIMLPNFDQLGPGDPTSLPILLTFNSAIFSRTDTYLHTQRFRI